MVSKTGRKRVVRVAALVALWLALGVIVNLAVAWICVLRAPRVGEGLLRSENWIRDPDPTDYGEWTCSRMALHQAPVFGVQTTHWHSELSSPNMLRQDLVSRTSVALSSGWPRLSFWCAAHFEGGPLGMNTDTTPSDWGIWTKGLSQPAALRPLFDAPMATRMAGFWGDPHRLPLRPLWPGCAINTLVYATLLWIIWMLLGAARARLRAKPGACRACGYALAGLAERGITTCPECGAAARAGAVSTAQAAPPASPARSEG